MMHDLMPSLGVKAADEVGPRLVLAAASAQHHNIVIVPSILF